MFSLDFVDSCARLPRKALKVEFGRVRAKSSTSPFQPPPRRLFIVKLPVVTGTRCRTLSVVAVVVFIFTFDKQRLPHARNALYHNPGGGGTPIHYLTGMCRPTGS